MAICATAEQSNEQPMHLQGALPIVAADESAR
jgi:hypothetical protein